MPVILASQSPRRADLLRQIGVQFEVRATNIDESHCTDESAEEYVSRMAQTKAETLQKLLSAEGLMDSAPPILAADTAVVCGEDIFGKPQSKDHGITMLRQLSGTKHRVLSAVTLLTAERQESLLATTYVYFKSLPDDLIQRYWEFDEPKDKAGGYAIQGMGSVFVEKIEGSYSNVVGLPIETLQPLLDSFGVPFWQESGQ